MAEGAFQTDRKIFNNPIWKNVAKFRLFFFIYGNAVFAEEGKNVGGIHVVRGQFLRSYRNLAEDLEYLENNSIKRYSVSHIKKLIDELVSEQRLLTEPTELGTLFTVLNYEHYQGFERFKKDGREQRENSVRTAREQRENNNKNVKNDNNELIYTIFSHWNSKKIITHKSLTDKLYGHINARLKDGYSAEEIIKAIDNYATVLNDDKYFWTYKWNLKEFLLRGLDKFKDESEPFKNFLKQKGGQPSGSTKQNPRSIESDPYLSKLAWRPEPE
jgi:hypothetical protein